MFENWPKKTQSSTSVLFQEFDGEYLRDSLHEHSGFELVFIASGIGEWQMGASGGRFRPGSLLLCPPGLLHCWRSDGGSAPKAKTSGIVLRFAREALPRALLGLPEMQALASLVTNLGAPLEFEVPDRERLRARLRSVDRAQGALRLARFYVALELVASFGYSQVVADKEETNGFSARDLARIEEVKRLVQERFRGPVSRSEAAALVGLEEAAFSRFFRRAMGTTFVDFLSNYRVRSAAALLGSRRDLSLDEVAKQSGFGSLASLHRQFKRRIGTTPDSYRKAANSESLAP